jgi:hypothetical protein
MKAYDPLQPAIDSLPRLERGCTLMCFAWAVTGRRPRAYAGDMLRGFDVYRPADCTPLGCTAPLGLTFEVDPADALLVDPVTGGLG